MKVKGRKTKAGKKRKGMSRTEKGKRKRIGKGGRRRMEKSEEGKGKIR